MSNFTDYGAVADHIKSIVRTSGTGASGTVDTYTITTDSNQTFNFSVTNGNDGALSTVNIQEFLNVTDSTFSSFESFVEANRENILVALLVDGNDVSLLKVEASSNNSCSVFFWNGDTTGSNPTKRNDPILLESGMFANGHPFHNATLRVIYLTQSLPVPSAVYSYSFLNDLQSELGAVYTKADIKAYVSDKTVFVNVDIATSNGTPSEGADTYSVSCADLLADLTARGLIIPENGYIKAFATENQYFPIRMICLHKISGGLEFVVDISNHDSTSVVANEEVYSFVLNII